MIGFFCCCLNISRNYTGNSDKSKLGHTHDSLYTCNGYPGPGRVMAVGYPGSKFSTRFNPNLICALSIGTEHSKYYY